MENKDEDERGAAGSISVGGCFINVPVCVCVFHNSPYHHTLHCLLYLYWTSYQLTLVKQQHTPQDSSCPSETVCVCVHPIVLHCQDRQDVAHYFIATGRCFAGSWTF